MAGIMNIKPGNRKVEKQEEKLRSNGGLDDEL